MSKIDVAEVKKKILNILQQNGPSLPLPVAKQIAMQPMFASAILSELLNEKKIKTSSLKVGSSPLYLLPGQEDRLEAFADNLTGVEKEAYITLKDNKFLEDSTQEPRIRVALRGLKDFAVPLQMGGKMYWKYFTLSTEKIKQALEGEGEEVAVGERVVGQKILQDIKKEDLRSSEEKYQEIIEKSSEKREEPSKHDKIVKVLIEEMENSNLKEETKGAEPASEIKQQKMKKLTEKDLFLENVKRTLHSKNIEILETIQYDKKQVIAKARVQVDKTCILFFFDKKRPDEKDLVKAYKKSAEYKLPYYIITNAEAPKKIKDNIEIYKRLLGIDSLE